MMLSSSNESQRLMKPISEARKNEADCMAGRSIKRWSSEFLIVTQDKS